MNPRLLAAAALPIACAISLTACSSSSTSGASASATTAASSAAASAAASSASSTAASTSGGKQSECNQAGGAPKPVTEIPAGPTAGGVTVIDTGDAPPSVVVADSATSATSLVSLDVKEGTGTAAKAGDTLTVQYCGVSVPEGTVFDSSWVSGQAATFPLDGLIAGWQEGIPGMKVGGTRLLVIPGDKAYGPNPPSGSGIAPNATLAFVITLTDITAAKQ